MANIGDESNHACKTGSGGKGLINVDRFWLGENLRHQACLESRTAVVSYLTVYTHGPPKTWTPYGGVRCVRTYHVLLAKKKTLVFLVYLQKNAWVEATASAHDRGIFT
jgi:hypothetical protein